jgi:hypothetical protein
VTRDDLALDRVERVLQALPRLEPRPEPAARLCELCHDRLASRVPGRSVLASLLQAAWRISAGRRRERSRAGGRTLRLPV